MSLSEDSYDKKLITYDDYMYFFVFTFSTFIGFVFRLVKSVKRKQLLCTSLGFLFLLVLCGSKAIYLIFLIIINTFILISTSKRYCHIISFCFCFGYLTTLRIASIFNYIEIEEFTNVVLMLLTLKTVGLAFEVNEAYLKNLKPEQKFQTTFELSEILQYSFCYIGMLAGPYYTYKTYKDYFNMHLPIHIPYAKMLLSRIKIIPLYTSLYLISKYYFSEDLLSSLDLSFIYRIFYITPWYFTFRMRMYIAFVLCECSCLSLGFGLYPSSSHPKPVVGPTVVTNRPVKNADYSYETVRCMNELTAEFHPTMKAGIRYWNLSVQYWLAAYVYKRIRSYKPIRIIAVMFVSAVWHGLYPGYYFSLLNVALILSMEDEVLKAFRKNATLKQQRIFDCIWYIVKMKLLAYLGVAFVFRNFDHVLIFYKSIFFSGHVITIILFFVAFIKNKLNTTYKTPSNSESNNNIGNKKRF